MNKCLIAIDCQNDFIYGALGSKEAQKTVPFIKNKVDLYKEEGHCIIFTRDTHQSNYLNTQEGKKLPVIHCIEDSVGWEIIPELQYEGMMCINKNTFGCIELPKFLAKYDEIEFVGHCSDICVVSNVLLIKAHYPEKKIVVDGRCCAGVSPERHKAALATMKSCQIEVIND